MSASRERPATQAHERERSVRYPEVQVHLHTGHPLALVSAVRYALRRAGIDAGQISLFSGQALEAHSGERARRVCSEWVTVEAPAA